MGRIFPKVYLKWREPKAVRRVKERMEEKALHPLVRPLLVAVLCGIFVLAQHGNRQRGVVHFGFEIGALLAFLLAATGMPSEL